ncbi:excalibur calcium-binding domain-containing protein [Propionicimonas sp.]|uniref:excalibur calcium-binding domain-containing protein n=1 Tax=Propionicimonas sp. TaxID=1955623 RepID=UPI0039E4EC00
MSAHRLSRCSAAAASFALVLGLYAAPAGAAEASSPQTVVSVTTTAGATAAPRLVAKATKFKNCTKLHKKYRHGVGKKGATDHVSGRGKRVTNFTRNNAAYAANRHLDRDKDGIACEQH